MSRRLALLCLVLGACGLPEPRMPARVAIAVPVWARTDSGDSLNGARASYDFAGKHGWTVHFATQLLKTPEAEFLDPGNDNFDSVGEVVGGARIWRELGPLLVGYGGEVGFGRGGGGEPDCTGQYCVDPDAGRGGDSYGLVAAVGTVRWDPEVGDGALSFSADLQYRWTFDLDSRAVGTGIQADEMFSGLVFFIGAGWAW